MANYQLNAYHREGVGKNKVDKLRATGKIPAVVYQKDKEAMNVYVEEHRFNKLLEDAGMTQLVDLQFEDGEKHTVLIKEVQKHSYKNLVLHIDFQAVRMDQAIRVMVPIVLLHREEIIAQPSVLNQMLDEVEVECLPGDIPTETEYDVENMQIGEMVAVKDLDVSKNAKLTVLTDAEEPVCALNEPVEVVEEETEEQDASEVPEIGKEEQE